MEKKEGKAVIPLFVPWMLFAGIFVLIVVIVFGGLRTIIIKSGGRF